MSTLRIAWLCLLVPLAAAAEMVPPKGPRDARIRIVEYHRDELYRLWSYVGQQILIEFAPHEHFLAITGGDLDALTIGAEANSLSIKPRVALVDSNFTIITTERFYHLRYSASVKGEADTLDDAIFAVRFRYPEQEERAARAERLEALLAAEALTGPQQTDYWYCGHPSLKPIEASDNGIHTRLRFAGQAEWPAVFVRFPDGAEGLVNYSVHGDTLIIHRVAREFVLRRGPITGCIVNRGFTGAAERAQSGTTSPEVHRTIKERRP